MSNQVFKVGETVDCGNTIRGDRASVVAGPDNHNCYCIKTAEGSLYVLSSVDLRSAKPKPTALLVEFRTDVCGRAVGTEHFDTEPEFHEPTSATQHRFVIPLCSDGQPVVDPDVLAEAGFSIHRFDGGWAYVCNSGSAGTFKTFADAWRAASDLYRKHVKTGGAK